MRYGGFFQNVITRLFGGSIKGELKVTINNGDGKVYKNYNFYYYFFMYNRKNLYKNFVLKPIVCLK